MTPPSVLRQEFSVPFSYSVHFGEGLFTPRSTLLAESIAGPVADEPKKVLVVLDDGLLSVRPGLVDEIEAYAAHHCAAMKLCGPVILVPGGEAAKNDDALVQRLHAAIHENRICRHSYVLAIGGGAVLDMAGFAAATAHRGVRHIRMPTTVLAQCDSGVGVKNGVNAFGKKNFLGTFSPPSAVLNDSEFLQTLDVRDWRAGMAEAVKVALIKDAAFFAEIERNAPALAARDMQAMRTLVFRCAQLHLQHIARAGDPFELGSSRPLDFGHWAAHKLEQLSEYRLRHGEAVAIGIALDSTYSHLAGMLSEPDWRRILDVLRTLGFNLFVPELRLRGQQLDGARLRVFEGLAEFREHLGGRLTIMLLQAVGRGIEVHAVNEAMYHDAIGMLEQRHRVAADS